MTNNEAIEIINKKRMSNPFTMGCSLDEYVVEFRKRYLLLNGAILENSYIAVAKEIEKNDKLN